MKSEPRPQSAARKGKKKKRKKSLSSCTKFLIFRIIKVQSEDKNVTFLHHRKDKSNKRESNWPCTTPTFWFWFFFLSVNKNSDCLRAPIASRSDSLLFCLFPPPRSLSDSSRSASKQPSQTLFLLFFLNKAFIFDFIWPLIHGERNEGEAAGPRKR